jgi:uncharacterized metal-binding protein YceD (DUF177 family)
MRKRNLKNFEKSSMRLAIFLDRLKKQSLQILEEKVPSSFFSLDEEERLFSPYVEIKGQTYLASDHLIIELRVSTQVSLPCCICNQFVVIDLRPQPLHHAEEVALIPSGIFDYSSLIREQLLLEVPAFAECNGSQCPERELLKKFLKKENAPSPFQNL